MRTKYILINIIFFIQLFSFDAFSSNGFDKKNGLHHPQINLPPTVTVTEKHPCHNENNGMITLNFNPSYTYLWSNSATTNAISGLSAGTYTYTVTDVTTSSSVTGTVTLSSLKAYARMTVVPPISTSSCQDPKNHTIETFPSNGTPPYTYLWSDSTKATTKILTGGFPYGHYNCTVTDANGCSMKTTTHRSQLIVVFHSTVTPSTIASIRTLFKANQLAISLPSGARLWEIPDTLYPFNIIDGGFTYTINNIGDAVERVKNQPGVGASGLNHDIGQPKSDSNCSFGIDTQNGDNLTPLCSSEISDITVSCSTHVKIAILDSPVTLNFSNILAPINVMDSSSITSLPKFCNTLHGPRVVSIVHHFSKKSSNISILPITVLNDYGMGTVFNVIKGVDTANILGVKLLNMSFIGTDLIDATANNSPLKVAIDSLKSKNALAIKAAGNGDNNGNGINFSQVNYVTKTFIRNGAPFTKTYKEIYPPAILENTNSIVVGAYGCNEARSIFSNYDSNKQVVEIFAPGENIFTWHGNNHTDKMYSTGTSFAAPIVTGVAALLQCQNNYSTIDSLKNAILNYPSILKNPTAIGLKLNAQSSNSKNANGSLFNFTKKDVSCNGAADASIDATIAGNPPGYNYLWDNGSTTSSRNGLTVGVYCVTITDTQDCTKKTCFTITEPAPLIASITQTTTGCAGASNGSATVNAIGGTPHYKYLWSNGQTSQTATNLDGIQYTVTVTDANGCTDYEIIIPAEYNLPVIPDVSVTNATCQGICNGMATILNFDPNNIYSWSNGMSGSVVSGLCAGTYILTVTTAQGCTRIEPVTITEPATLIASITQTTTGCAGASNGSATVNAIGGTPPYAYLWSNGQTSQTATNLDGIQYTVTVTDANDCTAVADISIEEIIINENNNLLDLLVCSDEAFDIFALPSTSNFPIGLLYEWQRSNSPVGSWITISNGNASDLNNQVLDNSTSASIIYYYRRVTTVTYMGVTCQSYSNVMQVTVNPKPVQNNLAYSICQNTPLGIVLPPTLNGLSATYQLLNVIMNGVTADPNNAPIGTGYTDTFLMNDKYYTSNGGTAVYTLVPVSNNGCEGNAFTVTIIIHPPINITINKTDATCHISCNGSATVTATGGTPTYTYLWNDNNNSTTATISGLCAGIYTCTVTDANGCTAAQSVVIQQNNQLIVDAGADVTLTCTNPTTTLTASPNVPWAVGFFWSNGETTASISVATAGTYTVTITESNGCTATDDVMVFEDKTPPMANAGADQTVNCLVLDATLTATGGGTYLWSNGNTTASITVMPSVTTQYFVTVTSANGCSAIDTVTVTVIKTTPIANAGLDVTISAAQPTATLTATGGIAYVWSNGASTASITVSPTMTTPYTVTVTDVNGCTATDWVLVTVQRKYNLCFVNPEVIANKFRVTLRMSSVDGLSLATNNLRFNYNPSVIANPVILSENFPSPAFSSTSTTGSNQTNGIMSINTAYNGAVNANILPITPSGVDLVTMEFTIINPVGIANLTWRILGPNPRTTVIHHDKITAAAPDTTKNLNFLLSVLSITGTTQQNINCHGQSTGSASVNAINGVLPYEYHWSNGATTQAITNLSAGVYTVTVTDAQAYSQTATVTITQPAPLTVSAAVTNVSCFGGVNGSINITPSGGADPYEIDCEAPVGGLSRCAKLHLTCDGLGGTFSQNIFGGCKCKLSSPKHLSELVSGSYDITVTDTNGCTATTTATITEPAQLTANVTVSNVSIHGASNGSVTITPFGGTAPYTISGNTTGLSAGTYHFSVTDANGCTFPITETITEPDPLIVSTTVTNVSCHGGSNGNVAINVTGGVAPYTISGNTTNLTAGTYVFTVTDNNGATAMANATITQPAQIEVTDTTLTHIICNGSCDGAVNLNVTGGSGNSYSYLWNTGDTTSSLSNICADDYSCTILDINGCAVDISIEITEPANPLVITDNILTYTSLGQCSGSVLFQASGGTAPYLWSNGTTATTVQLTNLCAGTHTITVEDANNCLIDAEILINAADSLLLKTILTGKALCNNPNSGQATVIASGGRTPYSYAWSNGETTNVATQLYVGTNHCTVTDANGSKASVTILIDQEKLSAFVDSLRVPCYQENNGYILANANNCTGSLTYTYQWSNGATTQSIGNLAAGVYSCSITASNGCSSVVDNIQLLENSPILAIPTVWNSSTSVCDGKIVLNQGITPNYTYTWNHNNQIGSQIQNLCAGQYQCTISDPLSCKTVTSITVGLETPFSTVLVNQNTTNCNSVNCTGFAKIQAIGGTPPYAYLWANGSTTQDINNVCEGSYYCTITDVKGKTITDTVTILKEDLPYTVDSIKMSCPNANQGYISIGCADTSCNFSYNWSNSSTNNAISNLNPGIYYCTITDNSKGCQAVEDITIEALNCNIKVALKVYLENINTTTGLMDDYIKTLANFPLSDPYRLSQFSNSFTHVNNATTQTTTPSVLAATGNNAIVDWMFLELRQGISGSTTVAKTKAALIQRDGDIVDMDGVSPVDWGFTLPTVPAEYFIAVRHRNHLGFRTSDKYFLSNMNTNHFDFTNNSIPLYGTTPLQNKSSTIQAMIGGDANSDGSTDAFDSIVWETQNGLFDDYFNNADYNLDGSVDAFDSIIWELSNGKFQELD